MEINFGTNYSKCNIIFDVNGNYTINNASMEIVSQNNWNGRVAFPNGIKYVKLYSPAFDSSLNAFNSKVEFSNTVQIMYGCFQNRRIYNKPTNIPSSVTGTGLINTFLNCANFNQNIQIPNSVTSMVSTFSGCSKLNQNIQIPNNVTAMASTFSGCRNLNQNIQIPNSVTNTVYTFDKCNNLNQNIQIPNSVTNSAYMFNSCSNFNQNIQIPNSINNIASMFFNCNVLSDITILPKVRQSQQTSGLIRNNATQSINIWTDSETAISIMNSGFISSGIRPTMETITNGYYNAQYNVYIYTNTVFS